MTNIPETINDPLFFPGDTLHMLGRPKTLYWETSHMLVKNPLIQLDGERLIVCGPIHFHQREYQAKLIPYFRQYAYEFFQERLLNYSYIMQLSCQKLKVSHARSRWGSCSSSGTISLNWQLIRLPVDIMDYVIIHELAHRVHMNHSPTFWKLVAQYCPYYKTHREQLKNVSLLWGYNFWQIRA